MTDEISDATLDQRLRSVDPVDRAALPSEGDTEAVLRRLLAGGPPVAPTRRRRPARIRLFAGATVAAAALAAGLVILLGSSATSPAFAVTRNPNGTITVHLIRVAGIAGANDKLAALGVRARIVSLVDMTAYVASLHPCRGEPAGVARTITIDPATIPRRQVVLLTADQAARLDYYGSVGAKNAIAAAKTFARRAQALVARARALAATTRSARTSATAITALPATAAAGKGAAATSANRVVRVYCPSPGSSPPGLVKQRIH
jgi:hypothetical protein